MDLQFLSYTKDNNQNLPAKISFYAKREEIHSTEHHCVSKEIFPSCSKSMLTSVFYTNEQKKGACFETLKKGG